MSNYLGKIMELFNNEDISDRTYFYRYDEYVTELSVRLILRYFTVLRETPRGHWVVEFYNSYDDEVNEQFKKWVSKTSIKRLCYPTKKEAFVNFNRRKQRHLSILKQKVKIIELACKLTESNQRININEWDL